MFLSPMAPYFCQATMPYSVRTGGKGKKARLVWWDGKLPYDNIPGILTILWTCKNKNLKWDIAPYTVSSSYTAMQCLFITSF